MANTKISALPSAATITGTEVVPVVQTGVTKAATVQQLLALVVASAPGNLDTFFEVATQMGLDEGTVTTLQALVAGKLDTTQAAATYLTFDGSNVLKGGTAIPATTVTLGASNGTDDSATITAALTAAAGKTVRGLPGQTYLIGATPIRIPSGTTLDMTGCTILQTTTTSGLLIQNQAAAAVQRTVTDGAITTGTATLTSATAAFTTADIGRTVYIAGALAASKMLVTTIASVTNATTVTLNKTAGATVTGAAVSLYNRDADIRIIGGYWNRAAGNGTGNIRHTTYFRHVDRLTVENASFGGTDGKYQLSIGDCADIRVQNLYFNNVHSDGVHIIGPTTGGTIRDIRGKTGDDLVSLTSRDWPEFDDVYGDITDLTIENLYPQGGGVRCVQMCGDPATAIKRIHVRNLYGYMGGTAPAVSVADDTLQANTTGVIYDDIIFENVATTVPNAVRLIQLTGIGMKNIRFKGVHFDNTAGTIAPIYIAPSSAATIPSISFEDLRLNLPGQNAITVETTATVTALLLEKVVAASGSNPNIVSVRGTVTDLIIRGARAAITNGNFLGLDGAVGTATVTRASIQGVHMANAFGNLISATASGHTLPRVEVVGCELNSISQIADLATTTELHLAGVTLANTAASGGPLNVRATANVTLKGDGNSLALGTGGMKVTAGGILNVYSLGIACDVSQLTKTVNALATNTNAALACGTGPVVCNGTSWKHLYTGLTY